MMLRSACQEKLKTAVILFGNVAFAIGCASNTQRTEVQDNPVANYETAKRASRDNPGADYALEKKKIDAAMSLYENAQTDLRSGNSAKAIGELALAREYNPWHDDIKDLYAIAVKHFVTATKQSGTGNCEVLNERLNFLSETAPDYLSQLKEVSERCKFIPKEKTVKLTETYVDDIKIPDNAIGSAGMVDAELLGDLDAIVKRNNHNPTHEILAAGLEMLSKLSINFGLPRVSQLAKDPNKFEVTLPINFEVGKGLSGKEYCEMTKKYLETPEPDPTPNSHWRKCPYWSYFLGDSEIQYEVGPNFPQFPDGFYGGSKPKMVPFPSKIVVVFKLKYKNKPELIVRDVINTSLNSAQVDLGANFNFDYVSGDLPLKLGVEYTNGQHEPWRIEEKNATIVVLADRKLVDGLIGVSAYIDLKATKALYL